MTCIFHEIFILFKIRLKSEDYTVDNNNNEYFFVFVFVFFFFGFNVIASSKRNFFLIEVSCFNFKLILELAN